MEGDWSSDFLTDILIVEVTLLPTPSVAVAVNVSVALPNEKSAYEYAFVKTQLFPLLDEYVAPESVTELIPILSVALTVKVAVLDCEEVDKRTIFEDLLLEMLLITGGWSSSVVIVIVFDFVVELPAASVTTTLIVSLLVEPTE